MLKSVASALKLEFELMIKEKIIFVVLIAIPLLVNMLLGLVLINGQIKHIPMAVVDYDNTSTSRMIVEQFLEHDVFDVKYQVNNTEEIQELFSKNNIRVGMIIPPDFTKDLKELQAPSVLMLYDGSHLSVSSTAKTNATEILMTLKGGVFIKLLESSLSMPEAEAKRFAQNIKVTSRTLYNPAKNFSNFLVPGFGMAIIQSGIGLMAAVCIRRKELKFARKSKIGYIIGKILFYTAISSISVMLCQFVQVKFFNVPFRGSFIGWILLSIAFTLSMSAFSTMISCWVRNNMFSIMINAVLIVPSALMVGYTWPVMSMPRPYQIASWFYPFYHYADNIRYIDLKEVQFSSLQGDILWLLAFAGIMLLIASAGVLRLKPEEEADK